MCLRGGQLYLQTLPRSFEKNLVASSLGMSVWSWGVELGWGGAGVEMLGGRGRGGVEMLGGGEGRGRCCGREGGRAARSPRCWVEREVEALWAYLLIKVYNSMVLVCSRGCATITTI